MSYQRFGIVAGAFVLIAVGAVLTKIPVSQDVSKIPGIKTTCQFNISRDGLTYKALSTVGNCKMVVKKNKISEQHKCTQLYLAKSAIPLPESHPWLWFGSAESTFYAQPTTLGTPAEFIEIFGPVKIDKNGKPVCISKKQS